jgi:hypothetical protein
MFSLLISKKVTEHFEKKVYASKKVDSIYVVENIRVTAQAEPAKEVKPDAVSEITDTCW